MVFRQAADNLPAILSFDESLGIVIFQNETLAQQFQICSQFRRLWHPREGDSVGGCRSRTGRLYSWYFSENRMPQAIDGFNSAGMIYANVCIRPKKDDAQR